MTEPHNIVVTSHPARRREQAEVLSADEYGQSKRPARAIARRVAARVRASFQTLMGRTASPLAVAHRPLGWWSLLPFSTHRIQLAPGRYTMDGDGVEADQDVRTSVICEGLGDSFSQSAIVDLGCLEGGFTVELARRGARHVVGIEARQLSVDRCNLVRDVLRLTNVEFRCADVRDELPRWPKGFDAVLASGILYHLADPAELLRFIRSACRNLALIDTHVAVASGPTHACSADITELRNGSATYSGRMYREFDPSTSDQDQQSYLWASYGNPQSFWPFEEDLVRMLKDAGFEQVEKIDPHACEGRWQVDQLSRAMYLCRV